MLAPEAGAVRVWVVDNSGRIIRMVQPFLDVEKGISSVQWDGLDLSGSQVPA